MTQRSIGELAGAAQVNVETIRYYERRGLLPDPPRTPAGYRVYDDGALWRLEFIARAKTLGFTLAEIGELLEVGEQRSVGDVIDAAHEKLQQTEERIAAIAAMQDRLRQLIQTCQGGDIADCVSLEGGQRFR